MKKVYKIPLVLLIFAVLSYIFKYALNMYLARHLPEGMYGDLTIAFRVLSITGTLILLGSNVSAKRFLVKYLARRERDKIGNYVKWNLKLLIISSSVIVGLMLLMTVLMLILHLFDIKNIFEYHLAVYMLWVSPLVAFSLLAGSYLLCNQNYIFSAVSLRLGKYALLLGMFVSATMFLKTELNSAMMVAIVFVVFFILSTLQITAILKKQLFTNTKIWKPAFIEKRYHEQWMRVSLRLALTSMVFLISTLVDLLIVEIIAPHEYMVDQYSAILTITGVIILLPDATNAFVKPKINELISLHRKHELQAILNRFNYVQLLIITIITLLVVVFSKTLLSHFGSNYIIAEMPLIILSIGYMVKCCSTTAITILSVTGNESVLLYSITIELIALVIFCTPATYFYGIVGTAAVTASLVAFRGLVLIFMVRKRVGLKALLFI